MLVDDAVVVVEAIYYRLQRGADTIRAAIDGLKEINTAVTTAVLTTMAAFLPLMLLPGILGKFMIVIPLVITIALAISLIELIGCYRHISSRCGLLLIRNRISTGFGENFSTNCELNMFVC